MSNSEAHDSLFDPLQRFLSQNWHYPRACQLVEPSKKLSESGVEIPDIIAWRGDMSVVIDAKVSLDDCQAHLRKPHVKQPWRGMGVYRYVAVPAELHDAISAVPMPDDWGLLVVVDSEVHQVDKAERWPDHARNWRREMSLLQRALMKAQQGAPSGGSNGKSTQAKLTTDEAAAVRNALADLGMANAKEIAWWIQANAKTSKTKLQLRNHIGEDVRNGRLEGVAVPDSHSPVRLTLAGEEAQEVEA